MATTLLSEPALAPIARARRLTLVEVLERSARKYPDKTALRFEGQERTFAALERRARRSAHVFAERGVRHGDRVAVLMDNCLEILDVYFGLHKLGACPVPLNPLMAVDELAYVMRNAAVAGIASGHPHGAKAEAAVGQVSTVRSHLHCGLGHRDAVGEDFEAAMQRAPERELEGGPGEDDLAFLMYTSGTTGRPKGVMLTHQGLFCVSMNWLHELKVRTDDVWLAGLPLFHIGGLSATLPFLQVGGTNNVMRSTAFDPALALRMLESTRATMCCFVPTQWQAMCTLPQAADLDVPHLRLAIWGASGSPIQTIELIHRTFPGVGMVNALGQTEMSPGISFLDPARAIDKIGSVGRPAINVEVRVVDDDMNDVPAGEVGEFVYRGPNLMLGYWDDEEATREAFAGGWFHSGDLGYQDEEGFLFVVDRKKDMIISGGLNIYPAEVERVLLDCPGVVSAAVIGVPHPHWVETPVAVLTVEDPERFDKEAVLAYCAEHMAGYKKPREVVVLEALPQNATGKILKRVLREDYRELFTERTQS